MERIKKGKGEFTTAKCVQRFQILMLITLETFFFILIPFLIYGFSNKGVIIKIESLLCA